MQTQVRFIFCFFIFLTDLSAQKTPSYSIGVRIPLEGPYADYGRVVREAILQEINPQIKYVFEDEGCVPKKAVSAI